MSEVSAKLKQLTVNDILMNYENFDALITEIFNIFEH